MGFKEIRENEYPALNEITFLDAACVSVAPARSVKALKEFVDYCGRNDEESSTAHHVAMDARRGKAYIEAAKLLNADIEEIALVESITHALNIAANCIPLNKGDIILTTSLEFLQVNIPWYMKRDKDGTEIVVIPGRDGKFTVEDFAAYYNERVKLIVISSVEWCNGWRIDLEELGQFCKEKNIYLVVDAIHEIGALKIDTKKIYVDIMAAGGHKWLNSPFGTGIMYVRKDLIPKLKPVFWGYLNLEAPEGGWGAHFGNPGAMPIMDWQFPEDKAKKFEIGGTTNYLGAIALGESLALANEMGIENIEKHILELRDYCCLRLKEAGAHLITHEDPRHKSGLVVFRFYKDLKDEKELLDHFHKHKVYLALRFTSNIGGIRVTCHYFNTKEDIDRMIEVLNLFAQKKAPTYI